ncbi:hypothetical protein [Micromonospora endophytica]|uniref:Uncharacterized protein n=1 Tax=Micromonospora endophytica TaxID=515350 RepID=A0A2W2C394_9ACTN|nr:hypothetical protein [Micromonospora endophytica]PZF92320.1 hypothetical protein C1I93_19620 [Micromonospora endophytica]RIW40868.1 hypothetical protein D3H59_27835 [Micromonospora endophytica]BCJ59730.1 hypothetical protein Jiend_31520 [Micromonospora endophytica]
MTAAWPPADHSTAAWPPADHSTTGWPPADSAVPLADHSTAGWPAADDRLERGYRRLLLAFPRRHRHRHGTELVTTLLEMAEPGQRRPRLTEALHLVGSGLRLRFRLPAGRPIMALAALLTALVVGGFGAAAGSWLGAQTFADLPDEAAMARLTQQAGGTSEPSHYRISTNWHAEWAQTTSSAAAGWDAEQVRQRFADGGWSVSALTPVSGKRFTLQEDGTEVETPLSGARFTAEANGLLLDVRGYIGGDFGSVHVDAGPARTAAFLPIVIVGTVLGLVVGWLIAAAVAYRMAAASPGRRVTAAGFWGLALLALALPAVALYGNLVRVIRHGGVDPGGLLTVHSAFIPGEYYYPFGPAWLILGLSIAGLVTAVATVLVARPGEQPPQPAVAAG